jgi:predicted N-acetyltransferase YhbS
MSVTKRHYRREDGPRISEFLIRHYRKGNADGNWIQPAWEYALTHPYLDQHSLGAISVWEEAGEIVAVVHYEHRLGEAFFQIHPDHADLKPAMIDAAEVNLRAANNEGHVCLRAFVNDFDAELETIVRSRGYVPLPAANRPLNEYQVTAPLQPPSVPDGFKLLSLADDNDLSKMDRVLWRGFNHGDRPPENNLDARRKMQSGPNYRKDLAIVVQAPDGEFVAFCGMWYVPAQRYACVEPVATDPDYRRRGLGRAVVMEGVRRCAAEGATVAYVGSDQEFYKALGFTERHTANCWQKRFDR